MDNPSLQTFAEHYRKLSDEGVEAELERWWSGSHQHKILLGILSERHPRAQRGEPAETVNDKFALAWEDLRARRSLYWISVIAVIPFSVLCAFLLEYWDVGSSVFLLLLIPIVCHFVAWQRLNDFNCPRCGQTFLWLYPSDPLIRSRARPLRMFGMPVFMQPRCATCGLPKFALSAPKET